MSTWSQVALDRVRENLLDVMGQTVRGLMVEPDVTDTKLNPPLAGEKHGRLWVARQEREREAIGFMPADQAMRLIGAVVATKNLEVTEAMPNVQSRLITDGSRFQGNIPPVVAGPFFAIGRHGSVVFSLRSYVDKGIMTERQKAIIEAAIEDRLNILAVGSVGARQAFTARVPA